MRRFVLKSQGYTVNDIQISFISKNKIKHFEMAFLKYS